MRTNLNERSSEELLEVMNLLGYTSTNHTLNVIITQTLQQLKKSNTHKSEVILNDHSSTSTNQ